MTISENSRTTNEELYFIPMEVTAETARDYGIRKADIVPARIGNKLVSAYMVPSTKEQYYEYMRPLWAEMQREERARRCLVPNGKGRLVRCTADCRQCEKMKDGQSLSLEGFKEESGAEFSEAPYDETDIILSLVTLEDLIDKLNEISPEYGRVISMLYDGLSRKAISALLDKPVNTTKNVIRKARDEAKKFVKREDLNT